MMSKTSIKDIAQQLSTVSDTPYQEAKIILSTILEQSFTALALQSEFILTNQQLQQLANILRRRLANEPLAYCVGWVDFYGLRIKTQPGVLIPRPETEYLVEFVTTHIKETHQKDIVIAELGIGTGAILCAIGSALSHMSKAYTYFGWDVNSLAILNSSQNIAATLRSSILSNEAEDYLLANNSHISIAHTSLINLSDFITSPIDYFLSNPPYIQSATLSGLDKSVTDHEPVSALDGGKDGLDVYRHIHNLLVQHQQLHSTLPVLGLEIDPPIAAAIPALFSDLYPNGEVRNDLFGMERYYLALPKSDHK